MIAFPYPSFPARLPVRKYMVYMQALLGCVMLCGPISLSAQSNHAPTSPTVVTHTRHITSTHPASATEDATALHSAPMISRVLASALAFIAPRTLEPYTIGQLCRWGLNGLTTLDPALSFSEKTVTPGPNASLTLPIHLLVLLREQDALLESPMPDDSTLKAWVTLSLTMIQTAWTQDSIFRSAGETAILPAFFDELFNHLDPYSRYLPPQEAYEERDHRQGITYSVGLTLNHQTNGLPVITAINVNSPAWEQGIDIGQNLLAVNGRSTRHISLQTVQHWLYGPPNSIVTLTLSLPDGATQTYRLQRVALPPETVFPERIGRYTALKITRFSTQTAEEVSQYLSAAMPVNDNDLSHESASGVRLPGIILDLRGNHGGVLQQAVITAALLIDNGIAASTEGRNPAANHIWTVQGGDITNGSPVVVLVDGQTASAAEVLAAALADRQRAVVIGSSTLGKGLVQIISQMPNGGELFVTWSRNLAPLGWPIQGLGVIPQLCTARGSNFVTMQINALRKGHSLNNDLLRQARMVREPVQVDQLLDIRGHCPASTSSRLDVSTAMHLLALPEAYQTALHSVPDNINALSGTLH